MQALLAQERQMVFHSGALAITANLQGGDTTIVAGGINFIPSKLVVRPDIKTPEGLKGKRIAISRFGSASDYATQVALEKWGVNPKEGTIVEVGGNVTRLVALGIGTIHATLLSEPMTTIGIRQYKLNSLIDLAESGVPFPQNCFIVKRSYLEANRVKIVDAMRNPHDSHSPDGRRYRIRAQPPDRSVACAQLDPRWATRDRPDLTPGTHRADRGRFATTATRKRRDCSAQQRKYLCDPEPAWCTGGGKRPILCARQYVRTLY
jgi:hypothetical protein